MDSLFSHMKFRQLGALQSRRTVRLYRIAWTVNMKLPLSSSVCDDGDRDAEFFEIYSTVTDIFAEYTPVCFIVTSKALNRIQCTRDSAYHSCFGASMA